jgi:hypothetical protein
MIAIRIFYFCFLQTSPSLSAMVSSVGSQRPFDKPCDLILGYSDIRDAGDVAACTSRAAKSLAETMTVRCHIASASGVG